MTTYKACSTCNYYLFFQLAISSLTRLEVGYLEFTTVLTAFAKSDDHVSIKLLSKISNRFKVCCAFLLARNKSNS